MTTFIVLIPSEPGNLISRVIGNLYPKYTFMDKSTFLDEFYFNVAFD